MKNTTFWGLLASLGCWLGGISGAIATQPHPSGMDDHPAPQSTQFQRIDQPLSNKIIVTIAGLGLIGLELWWFLLSKPTKNS